MTEQELEFFKFKSQVDQYEEFTFFWEDSSPFSQWFKSKFSEKGKTFLTCEHYMMYHKALLFGDISTAEKILQIKHPREVKSLGRGVKDFNNEIWNQNRVQIVYNGNRLKFESNGFLKKQLLLTSETTLVEASPYDTIWGIGYRAENKRSHSRKTWNGDNLLGEILTQLRTDLNQGQY